MQISVLVVFDQIHAQEERKQSTKFSFRRSDFYSSIGNVYAVAII